MDAALRLEDAEAALMWSRREFVSANVGAAFAAQIPGRSPDDAYWRNIRRAFTLDRQLINLNNGNSSPSPRVVHDALMSYLDATNRLPVHYRGQIEERFEGVRRHLAAEFGCDPTEMALTRNATEALHIAQNGIELRAGDEVITTDQDYPRMLWAWDQRARRDGIRVVRIQFPVPATAADLLERFERAITPRTRVLQFCHMTNMTGQLFPVRELSLMARRRGLLTIVDGAQAAAHIPFKLGELGCDFYGTSLHKWLMAPQGTGFLYVRREMIERTWPLQASTENLRGDVRKFEEAGTQSAAARAAIDEALAFHQAIGVERKAARLQALTLRWANALKALPRIRILSSLEPDQTWGLAAVGIDGVNAPALARTMLQRHRIVVSAVVPQGLPGPVFDFQGLRITPNVYTTFDEIDAFVRAIEDVLKNGIS